MTVRFLIANAYGVGGTIRATYNLAGELAKRHEVEIVSVQKHRDVPAFPVPPRVRVRALVDRSARARRAERKATGALARSRATLKGWGRAQRSRLVHPGDSRYANFNLVTDVRLFQFLRGVDDGVLIGTRAGLNLALARLARPSVIRIGQEHLNMTRYGEEIRSAFRRYYPRLDAYSALTEGDAAAFVELLSGGTRVVSIPNGVPAVGAPRSSNESKIVVAAGRLTHQKGFGRLLTAWSQVARTHPDWELRIFGEGKLRPRLEQQIGALGLATSARLMGYTNRLHEEMAAASFYVMSSRFEGFPMVLLEAMTCGLPVVSFDCPNGPRDLITEGSDGFLVPEGDVALLARAITEMIELGEARRAFGQAALRKAKQYELPAIAARWEELVDDLTAERGRRARHG
ncbi:MAG: glycosyltransferase family 4 protein [Actinomycetota bacterium]|nr:glycosyltransferase family 4 protein [Actinomycetota bacterium]